MSSWLSNRLGVHLNLRPLAPIAGGALGALIGGPAGAAWGSGLGRSLDDLGHGQSVGRSLEHGAITGGATYLGGKALQQLGGMFSPSSGSGAGAEVAAPTANASYSAAPGGGWAGDAAHYGAAAEQAASAAPGAMSQLGSQLGGAARGVGSFIQKNPTALSAGLQGLGSIGSMGAENRLHSAQADALQQQTATAEDERKRAAARAAAFAPLAQSLMGQLQSLYNQNGGQQGGVNPMAYYGAGAG